MPHEIPLDEAIAMNSLFRSNYEKLVNQGFPTDAIPKSETFEVAEIQAILDQGASAIRIYYGMTTDLRVHAVLVGVDSKGNDMFPGQPETGIILERALRCPMNCPPPSALNS